MTVENDKAEVNQWACNVSFLWSHIQHHALERVYDYTGLAIFKLKSPGDSSLRKALNENPIWNSATI